MEPSAAAGVNRTATNSEACNHGGGSPVAGRMDGQAHLEHDIPPKRGRPPPFRRNHAAAIATLCGLGFVAGMGAQWGLSRLAPTAAPAPYAAPPRALSMARAPRPRPTPAVAVPQAPAPTPDAVPATRPVTGAATVGLSRNALRYGRSPDPLEPARATAPTAPAAPVRVAEAPVADPPAPAVEAEPKPTAKFGKRKATRAQAEAAPRKEPSFDCRRARSPGEHLVCRNPRLAALDARMDAVYRRALAYARDPRGLKADQDRWMAVREGAALRDPSMVGPAYERRIAELSETNW